MNRSTFERRGLHVAVAPLVCLVLSTPLRADEAPANNPNDVPPAGVALDLGFPLQGAVEVDLANTQFALSAIHLAANTDLIGADVAQVDDVLRSHLGLGEGKGLVVTGVSDEGPAAKAGIQKNDVLTAVGNEEIAGLEAFRKSLDSSAEKPVSIGLIRAGKRQSIDVTPHSAASGLLYHVANQTTAEPKYWLGIGVASADDTLRSQLSLAAREGLVVTSVENDSPAAKAGIMVNDLLLKLDGKSLSAIEALTEQLQTIGERSVSVELLRRGKPAMLTVTPEKHADAVAGGLAWLASSSYWVDPVSNDQYHVAVRYPQWVAFTQAQPAQPDLAKQLSDLDAQVKQLEAAVAALRSTIEAGAQPAQGTGEKK
jgi:membrane-associated protease RseP (regulator of RpoE activity)